MKLFEAAVYTTPSLCDLMLPYTNDYLEWARAAENLLHYDTGIANLYSSAVREPTDMLIDDLRDAFPDTIQVRLDAPVSWGHPLLIEAIAREYNLADADRMLITSGCSMAYILVCRALLGPHDHVIVEAPTYQPFTRVLDAQHITYSLLWRPSPHYGVDFDALLELLTPETKLVVLSNLHNPTGAYLDDNTLNALAGMAQYHGFRILIDQVLGDLVNPQPAANLDDCFITINSLSKAYGLSVLRTGWIIAAPDVIQEIRPVHILFDNGTSRITQAMATIVFDNYARYRQQAVDLVERNRALVLVAARGMRASGLIEGEVPPQGNVFFPRLLRAEDADAVVDQLLEKARVLVVPGRFFGMPQHVRIGFGGETANLQGGLVRLANELRAMKFRESE